VPLEPQGNATAKKEISDESIEEVAAKFIPQDFKPETKMY
jgi:hypothetical protein